MYNTLLRYFTICGTILLLTACTKKSDTSSTSADQSTQYNYDFYWDNNYPNAQSLVIFKTQNIPEEASLMWYVNDMAYKVRDFKYTFRKGGNYIVKMVVNKDEAHSVTKEVKVAPASAYIEYAGIRVTGDTIYFKSYRTDGGQHAWDFGDGGTSTGNDPYHIYTKAGNYKISLNVTGLEDEPMIAATYIEIMDDPGHTAKMTNKRTWEITRIDFSLPDHTAKVNPPITQNFALVYRSKIEVGFPGPYLSGNVSYNAKASTQNFLVYTRSFGISSDTIIYDHIADTIYCSGTTWNVPPGAKSTDGTGTTYVMRAQ